MNETIVQLTHLRAFNEKFWQRVARSSADSCWLWRGTGEQLNDRYTYGFWEHGWSAHRAAYVSARGVLGSLCALHHCDVKGCCNPSHLFAGTQQDNTLDLVRKDLHGNSTPVDPMLWPQIRELAQKGMGALELSRLYQTSGAAIRAILTYRAERYRARIGVHQTPITLSSLISDEAVVAYLGALKKRRERCMHLQRLNDEICDQIRLLKAQGSSKQELSDRFNISVKTVCRIIGYYDTYAKKDVVL